MFVNNWYQTMLVFTRDDRPYNNVPEMVVGWDGTSGYVNPTRGTSNSVYMTPMSLFNQKPDSEDNPSIYFLSNNTSIFYGSGGVSTSMPSYWGVVLGDGDAPESLSDYWLSGNQITDFTANTSITIYNDGGKVIGQATYTIRNTGASSFTIKELAISRWGGSNTSPSLSKRYIIYRKVLETPLTIAAGDTGMLTFIIEISAQ